uniref:Kidney mitochondrial carrier protein 1 n=1 Tax=Lygus hesperus TaxID=30085 RepID=A0A146LY52_LYGHE
MQRAYIVNAAELATYDQAKTLLVRYGQCDPTNVVTHLVSSATAGVVAAVSSQPVDLIKNRLMHQSVLPDGTHQYTGMTQCGIDIIRREGFLALFKGVGANSCRIG